MYDLEKDLLGVRNLAKNLEYAKQFKMLQKQYSKYKDELE